MLEITGDSSKKIKVNTIVFVTSFPGEFELHLCHSNIDLKYDISFIVLFPLMCAEIKKRIFHIKALILLFFCSSNSCSSDGHKKRIT